MCQYHHETEATASHLGTAERHIICRCHHAVALHYHLPTATCGPLWHVSAGSGSRFLARPHVSLRTASLRLRCMTLPLASPQALPEAASSESGTSPLVFPPTSLHRTTRSSDRALAVARHHERVRGIQLVSPQRRDPGSRSRAYRWTDAHLQDGREKAEPDCTQMTQHLDVTRMCPLFTHCSQPLLPHCLDGNQSSPNCH